MLSEVLRIFIKHISLFSIYQLRFMIKMWSNKTGRQAERKCNSTVWQQVALMEQQKQSSFLCNLHKQSSTVKQLRRRKANAIVSSSSFIYRIHSSIHSFLEFIYQHSVLMIIKIWNGNSNRCYYLIIVMVIQIQYWGEWRKAFSV